MESKKELSELTFVEWLLLQLLWNQLQEFDDTMETSFPKFYENARRDYESDCEPA